MPESFVQSRRSVICGPDSEVVHNMRYMVYVYGIALASKIAMAERVSEV